jgi:hypothetical protein
MPTVSKVALLDPILEFALLWLLNIRLSGYRTIAINVTRPFSCPIAAAPLSPDCVVFILPFSDHSQDAPAASVTNEMGNSGGFSQNFPQWKSVCCIFYKIFPDVQIIFESCWDEFLLLVSFSNFFNNSSRLNLNPFMTAHAWAKSESFPCSICASERVHILSFRNTSRICKMLSTLSLLRDHVKFF